MGSWAYGYEIPVFLSQRPGGKTGFESFEEFNGLLGCRVFKEDGWHGWQTVLFGFRVRLYIEV
jgi:hypothetical protein